MTPELSRLATDRGAVSSFGSSLDRGPSEPSAKFLTDGYFSGFDDRPSSRDRGAGDSNYELTFALRDPGDDSGDGWEASPDDSAAEEPSSDETQAVTAPLAAAPAPIPWHHRFIETWGLALIGVALALIAIGLPVIAYSLCRMTAEGTSVSPSPATLIAGFACAVALLVVSVPLMLLTACLIELVRDLRRLRDHLGGRPGLRVEGSGRPDA